VSCDHRRRWFGEPTGASVNTAALRKLANNTGGYLLLTGHLTPASDDYFRLSKFEHNSIDAQAVQRYLREHCRHNHG